MKADYSHQQQCPRHHMAEGWQSETNIPVRVGSFYCLHCPRFLAINRKDKVVECSDKSIKQIDEERKAMTPTERNRMIWQNKGRLKNLDQAAKEALYARVKEMAEQLCSRDEIAHEVGFFTGTIAEICAEAGVKSVGGHYPAEQMRMALRYWNDGWRMSEIGEEMGFSYSKVQSMLKMINRSFPERFTRDIFAHYTRRSRKGMKYEKKHENTKYVWTPERVEELRKMVEDGMKQCDIAAYYGLTSSAISHTIKTYLKK